ncbi:helix-turn-helix transcriptional regulator [Clostridium sp.]|uniref:ArsR/SmtB family transcription factor n=1 Tax=Clostridium sp. TaxID=1506 RepID=UPI0026DD5F00|nr:metalloregulator ArsR/SmtB family transcription factor [Clostridium sp.]MDO5039835.1 metalloregulator ArsR/SmtB family transcription factor [Clostridium sp.]
MEEKTSEVLKALAHPVRLKIVKQLYDGPICVCHINSNIEYSQANVSKHLKILKSAKIVEGTKEGMFRYYKLKNEKIKDLIKLAEDIVLEGET